MGPFAEAFSIIIDSAAKKRTDINIEEFSHCTLYRGTGMPEELIQNYRKLSKDYPEEVCLYGWTSTSK